MNLLVYEPINQVQMLMVQTLIQNGFMVFATSNRPEITARLRTGKFSVLLLDCSPEENGTLGLLQEIRNDPAIAQIKIILHVRNASKPWLVEMVKLGVSGFVLKPFVPDKFVPAFQAIMTRIEGGAVERKHIRITPDPKDNATVTVRSQTTFKLINGRVRDVSMGGVLFQTVMPLDDGDVAVKQLLKNTQIKFRLNTIEVAALVIAKKDTLVGLKFFQINDFDKTVLSKYLYENLINEFQKGETSGKLDFPDRPVEGPETKASGTEEESAAAELPTAESTPSVEETK